jgi:hypothetical protein
MKLTFKRRAFGFYEKEVEITLNIGTLEAVCHSLGIEFYQIAEEVKKNNFDFSCELLWQGYLTSCKDSYRRPKYDKVKAIIWMEYMSKESQKEFVEKMTSLFGAITKTTKEVKKKVRPHLQNSEALQ